MKYILLINCLLITNLSLAGLENQDSNEEPPIIVITKEQSDRMGSLTVGQLFIFMDSNLPIPNVNATYTEVIKLIEQTNNKIIEDTGESVLVQCYKKNMETDEMEPALKTRYYFKEGVLARGPVPVDEQGNPLVYKKEGVVE